MSRSLIARILTLAVALTTAFAAPISALAHGYAHHEEHEVRGHVGDDGGQATSHGQGTVGAADVEHSEILHATIGSAVITRPAALVAIVLQQVTLPAIPIVSVSTPTHASPPPERPPTFAHAPPPRLRGPPAPIQLT